MAPPEDYEENDTYTMTTCTPYFSMRERLATKAIRAASPPT